MAGSEAGERHDWTVTGMDCAACASKITTALERLPGVADVQVGVMSERLSLRLEPGATGREVVEAVVKKLGYGIAPKGQSTGKRKFVFVVNGVQGRTALTGETVRFLRDEGQVLSGVIGQRTRGPLTAGTVLQWTQLEAVSTGQPY